VSKSLDLNEYIICVIISGGPEIPGGILGDNKFDCIKLGVKKLLKFGSDGVILGVIQYGCIPGAILGGIFNLLGAILGVIQYRSGEILGWILGGILGGILGVIQY